MTSLQTVQSHPASVDAYIRHGWSLVPIPMGTKFKIVPVIYVYLNKNHIEPTNAAKANNYLKRYLENDKLFREVIDVTNNRLGDYGFYIHDISIVNNNEITILIYKI